MTSEERLNSLFEVSARLDGIDGVVCHHIEGGGAGAAWIHVDLPNGQVVYFGNSGEQWAGELFVNAKAAENSDFFDLRSTEFPYDSEDFDGIAAAFRQVFMVIDVCLTGNPAMNGRCDQDDCFCMHGGHELYTKNQDDEPEPDHAPDATA